jgi:crotonobetainyl-CoA:carnitine CoA-transferase CaiB-like acyl-CoA transferase
MTGSAQILTGLRVLDLSLVHADPSATQRLDMASLRGLSWRGIWG